MRELWTFHSAGQLVFGPGSIARLRELAAVATASVSTASGGRKPPDDAGDAEPRVFVVTDAALTKAGVVSDVTAALGDLPHEVFAGGQPEPSLDLAEQCIGQARAYRPDVILGLGGGSNMDLAKVAAACLAHNRPPRDFVGDSRLPGPVMPLICVPTTAGTGSEVTAAAVLTDTAAKIKVGILSNYLRPRVAVVDPRLTLSCPAKVTADSGIDALKHAIVAYT